MTERQINLIKDNWGTVIAYSHLAGEIFYKKLFEIKPELQSLFKNSMKEQEKKLVFAVTLLITKLNKLDIVKDEVKYLSKRHIEYGVNPEDFEPFGRALLEMLKTVYQERWNKELALAWIDLYQFIKTAIIENMESFQAEQKLPKG
jgi:nitric oxide dioxygenase